MNTDGLVAAYDDLLSALRTLDPTGLHHDQRDEIDWIVAHLVLSDPILATAADHVLQGAGTATVDNRLAMDRDAIAAVQSSLSHHERIQTIGHTETSSSAGTAASPTLQQQRQCGSCSTTEPGGCPTRAPPPGASSSPPEQNGTSPATHGPCAPWRSLAPDAEAASWLATIRLSPCLHVGDALRRSHPPRPGLGAMYLARSL